MSDRTGISQRRRALLARLRDRKGRRREGAVLVEGVRAVTEALGAEVDVRFALVSPRLEALAGGAELRERLLGVPLDEVDDEALAAASDTESPQGVLLVCAEPTRPIVPEPGGRYLLLDAIQDPGNVGALVRSAAAFGLDAVVALDGSADPWGSKAVRASAGTVFRIPIGRMDAASAMSDFSTAGPGFFFADAGGEDVSTVGEVEGFALVVGNEGSGVREELRAAAGRSVAVRMSGGTESLNVGIAGAILLHELTRGRRGAGD